jgi:hypothetical protein
MYEEIAVSPDRTGEVWSKFLNEWIGLLDAYTKLCGSDVDVAYWYTERSLSGLLASAAWRVPCGWSLVEFSADRGKKANESRGSGDLWLGIGEEEFTVEAKLLWAE